jgi:hypothetical protein
MPILIGLLGVVLDIVLKAVTRKPEMADVFTPIVRSLIPALSQAAGETPAETAQRRTDAEAIFDKWKDSPVPGATLPPA